MDWALESQLVCSGLDCKNGMRRSVVYVIRFPCCYYFGCKFYQWSWYIQSHFRTPSGVKDRQPWRILRKCIQEGNIWIYHFLRRLTHKYRSLFT